MNPQSPKPSSAPCTLTVEPAAAALPKEALATSEPAPMPEPDTESVIREQDRLMPVANVSRIMRRVLPPYAKISDDAKEVIQECVSEFISFVTGEANERCHSERRKTVTSEDIVWAMNRLGFDDYVAPVSTFLQRMRESEGEDRGSGRGSRRGSSSAVALNGAHQMHPAAVYRHPQQQGVSPAYGVRPVVSRPVLPARGAPHLGGRYEMHGGGSGSMVPFYGGGAAFQAGGNQYVGFNTDEASSVNENPSAAAGRAAGSH